MKRYVFFFIRADHIGSTNDQDCLGVLSWTVAHLVEEAITSLVDAFALPEEKA